MHGNRKRWIVFKYRKGWRVATIAKEHNTTPHEVAKVLRAAGVSWLAIEARG